MDKKQRPSKLMFEEFKKFKKMVITEFHDMHSGGSQKLDWGYIYIEAPKEEAEIIFQNRFGRNPYRVTCTCCGDDYSIMESDDIIQATAFERGCRSGYVNSKGEEVPQEKAWIRGKGLQGDAKDHHFEEIDPEYSYRKYKTVDEYLKDKNILVIKNKDIKANERKGELEEEGYVWK